MGVEPINLLDLKEKGRYVEGFHEIFGKIFSRLGFGDLLPKSQTDVLLDVLLARIATPRSKSRTQKILNGDFGKDVSLDRIYRMMDELVENKDKVHKKSRLCGLKNNLRGMLFSVVKGLLFNVA